MINISKISVHIITLDSLGALRLSLKGYNIKWRGGN